MFNNVHVMPQDGNLSHWCPGSPQIHHQLFGFCCVKLQVVQLTPWDKVVHHSPVLSLLTLADTSNYSRVIRKLLKMARLCLVAKVCCVKVEEKRSENSPLWGPGVADHCIWDTVLQARVLWSASVAVHNPGHKGRIHQHRRQLVTQ